MEMTITVGENYPDMFITEERMFPIMDKNLTSKLIKKVISLSDYDKEILLKDLTKDEQE